MKSDQQQAKDATETWLHQSLGNYRPEAPADAWDRLLPHLPQRKRRNLFVFWWIFVAVAAAVALILFEGSKTGKPAPAKSDSASNEEVQTQGLTVPAPANPKQAAAPLFSEKAVRRNEALPVKNQSSNANSPISRKAVPEKLNIATSFAPALQGDPAPELFGLSATKESLQSQNSLQPLPVGALSAFALEGRALPEMQLLQQVMLTRKRHTKRFQFGIEAGPVFFMPKNKRAVPDGLVFPATQSRPGSGWQAGLSMAFKPLDNWHIGVGIQYFRQNYMSEHAATLRLMDGIWLNPNDPGLKAYQFQYAVVSGGGKSLLTLQMHQEHSGAVMPADEPFTLHMQTHHRLNAWRLPVTLERRISKGKWTGFAGGGVLLEMTQKREVEVAHVTELCRDLCFQNGHLPSIQVTAPASASIGWLASAGVERALSSCTALRFEALTAGQKGFMQYGLNLGLVFSP